MSTLTGTWDATLASPLGPIAIVFAFDGDGGTATASGETVPVAALEVVEAGDTTEARWGADVTRPLAVHLDFAVSVTGDAMTGSAKAGMLMPHGAVQGARRS